jgi:hypothetical protein
MTVYLKFRQLCQLLRSAHKKLRWLSDEVFLLETTNTSFVPACVYFCFTAIAEISTLALLTSAAA